MDVNAELKADMMALIKRSVDDVLATYQEIRDLMDNTRAELHQLELRVGALEMGTIYKPDLVVLDEDGQRVVDRPATQRAPGIDYMWVSSGMTDGTRTCWGSESPTRGG